MADITVDSRLGKLRRTDGKLTIGNIVGLIIWGGAAIALQGWVISLLISSAMGKADLRDAGPFLWGFEIVVALLLWGAYIPARRGLNRIQVYENGFIFKRLFQAPYTVLLDEITGISYRYAMKEGAEFFPIGMQITHNAPHYDRYSFPLNQPFAGIVSELTNILQQRLLPDAAVQLAQNKAVRFNFVSVSPSMLTVDDKSIPLSEIKEIKGEFPRYEVVMNDPKTKSFHFNVMGRMTTAEPDNWSIFPLVLKMARTKQPNEVKQSPLQHA